MNSRYQLPTKGGTPSQTFLCDHSAKREGLCVLESIRRCLQHPQRQGIDIGILRLLCESGTKDVNRGERAGEFGDSHVELQPPSFPLSAGLQTPAAGMRFKKFGALIRADSRPV